MERLPQRLPFRRKKVETVSRKPTKQHMNVILTGSTGSLGAYILDALLADPNVEKVTCFNRSKDAQKRQKQNHESRGLSTEFNPAQLEFLRCDLAAPCLGLEELSYRRLAEDVTHILHNAWPVDFNRHLSSFEPNICGIRGLINFASDCTHAATLFFVSSISAAARWGAVPGALAKVPEVILEDWRLAKMGYGQSKLVSERLLAEASQASGIMTAVCRVGQVAGPVMRGPQGVWNKQEWLPSLVSSSKYLKKLPTTLGPVNAIDWIPVDWLAKVIVELLPLQSTYASFPGTKKSKSSNTAVYHVVNPTAVPWSSLLPSIIDHIGTETAMVTFTEWVDELERSVARNEPDQQNLNKNPAAKLLPFFDELRDKALRFPKTPAATLDTAQTVQCSDTLASLDVVTPDWMALWMKQWDL